MINREPINYRQGSGIRRILIGIVVAVFLLLIFGRWLATLYTDFLWYRELGFTGVWTTTTFTRVWLVLAAAVFATVFFWFNLWLVDRLSPRSGAVTGAPDEELLERYQEFKDDEISV